MDYELERDFAVLRKLMEERFGEDPDLTSMVFAVGLQECGQGFRTFKKDEKLEVMHVGVCTLLAPMGYYEELGPGADRMKRGHSAVGMDETHLLDAPRMCSRRGSRHPAAGPRTA